MTTDTKPAQYTPGPWTALSPRYWAALMRLLAALLWLTLLAFFLVGAAQAMS